MSMTLKAMCASLLLATSATAIAPAYAQPAAPDRDWRRDRDDRDDHDRGDRRGGDHRGGHRDRDHTGEAIVGGVIGGVLGGLLHGENYNYRFRYDNDYDYYVRRGYGRGHYDRWRGRDYGYNGCSIIGYRYGRGCRTILNSRELIILNLAGEVFCYRPGYRGWRNTYCPRDWYRY